MTASMLEVNESNLLCSKCLIKMNVVKIDDISFHKCVICESILIDKDNCDDLIRILAIKNRAISFLEHQSFY